SGNVVGDDGLHVARSTVRIESCFFHDTNSDALDMDYSGGRVAGCRFERVGNDAIDLMTSSPVLTGNVMIDCGDKGVSAGERSSPLIYDSQMERCQVGVQIKDGSAPLILDCSITGCQAGIDAYRKNWRYGTGGRGRLVNSVVRGNGTDLSIRKESRLIVRSSIVGTLPEDRSRLELHHVAAPGEATPEPDVAAPALLVRTRGPAVVGLTGDGLTTTLRPLLADDRFTDGFVLNTDGWRLQGDVKLHVKGTRLMARLRTPRAALVRDYGLSGLPAGSRLHLWLSVTRPAAVVLRLSGDFGTVEKVLELDRQETAVVLGIPGHTLERVSVHAASRTTLRLHRAAVSVP
ncbi:MAG TPA: right-handed parallel beta-helix repeat-containing protein, partial [Acidobacteria bacterium]|nr:right-handed parallel beta-helix repeat-containing protein [Acidobacteriota bacterium]